MLQFNSCKPQHWYFGAPYSWNVITVSAAVWQKDGWENILHSQYKFYQDCQSASSQTLWAASLIFYCTSGAANCHTCIREAAWWCMTVNIRARLYILKHGLHQNHVCCAVGSVDCFHTSGVILGQEVYFCLIIFSWFLKVGNQTSALFIKCERAFIFYYSEEKPQLVATH